MSLNLTKNTFRIDSTVGMANAQAICKTTLELPEEKPDIGRILAAKMEAKLDASGIEVADNRVSVQGNLIIEAPYVAVYRADTLVSDREPVHFFVNQDALFKAEAEVIGSAVGMHALVDAEVDSFEVDVSGPRAISVTALVKIAVRVVDASSLVLVSDAADYDSDKIAVSKKTVFVERQVGENCTSVTIREAFQVPEGKADIGELLDYTAAVYTPAGSLRAANNRVVVGGTMDLRIAYLGDLDERPLQFLVGPKIDFQTAVDLPGAAEGMTAKGKGVVESLAISKIGSRTLQVDAVLGIQASAASVTELSAVEGISSAGDAVDVQMAKVRLESLVGQMSGNASIAESFAVGSGKPDIDEIILTAAKARITDIKVIPDKVTLVGEVDVSVTYAGEVSEAGEVAPVDTVQLLGLPFETEVEVIGVEAGMTTRASAEITDIELTKAGPRTVDIDVRIGSSIKVTEEVEFDAITDAAVVPSLPKTAAPSRRLTIYVVQQGDTMWKIARRYEKTMARIIEANRLNVDGIYPGQKILIPN